MMFRALGYLPRFAAAACLLAFLIVAQVFAGETTPVNVDANKVAIKGFDTVAYYTEGRPTMGIAELVHDWQGAKWLFATAEHRDMFAADPDKYAPRFGGYCAMGTSLGVKAEIDPEAWVIVDDKLYLTHSPSALAKFKVNTLNHIADAESFWEKTVEGN